ncbi:MAG: hypothetical protein AAF702_37625 [Chloroflexota bacterium]
MSNTFARTAALPVCCGLLHKPEPTDTTWRNLYRYLPYNPSHET